MSKFEMPAVSCHVEADNTSNIEAQEISSAKKNIDEVLALFKQKA